MLSLGMEGAALLRLIFWCCGISLSVEISVSNDCGTLSYPEPAIVDRNVILTFKPVRMIPNLTVAWRTATGTDQLISGWILVQPHWKYRLQTFADNFTLVINATRSDHDQGRIMYAQYGTCTSQFVRLNLTVIKDCGLLYKRTPNARRGDTMELGYFPTMNMVKHESIYARIFSVTNITCPAPHGCNVTNVTGVYKIWSVGYNHEYVLSIVLQEEYVNGRYRLRCTFGRENTEDGNVFTEYIDVRIPVQPKKPVLLNTTYIDDCNGCVMGILGQSLGIICIVSGGTPPLDVKVYVNNASMIPTGNDGVYSTSVMVSEDRHLADVRCTVTNIALDQPLVTTAKIYAAVAPKRPVITTNNVRESMPSTYPKCTVREARPLPNVTLYMKGYGQIQVTIDQTEDTYHRWNTSVTSAQLKKDWNLKKLACCSHHITYNNGKKCERQQLVYKFSPDTVDIQLADSYTQLLPSYNYTLTCVIARAYPACSAVWALPEGVEVLGTSNTTDGTGVVTTTSTLSLNVSKEDNRKKVTCTADCTGVGSSMSVSHTISVPYEPVILFNVTWPELTVTQDDIIVVMCTASWATEVRWLGPGNSTAAPGYSHCGPGTACLSLGPASKQDGGRYTCNAHDGRYNTSKSIDIKIKVPNTSIPIHPICSPSISSSYQDNCPISYKFVTSRTQYGKPTENHVTGNGGGLGSGALAGVVALAVCIVVLAACIVAVVMFRRRKTSKPAARHKPSAKSNSRPENRSENSPEHREENDRQLYENAAYLSQEPAPEPIQVQEVANIEKTSGRGAAQKELIYADLDLGEAPGSQTGTVVIRGENETEYVDIDFTKKAEPLPDSDVEDETENVYMNQ